MSHLPEYEMSDQLKRKINELRTSSLNLGASMAFEEMLRALRLMRISHPDDFDTLFHNLEREEFLQACVTAFAGQMKVKLQ